MNLVDQFERCYCINLARRPDRWQAFQKQLGNWPFVKPVRFEGIDGKQVPHPQWFGGAGMNGAWGALCSHRTIIERCLNEGVQSVLVLEDDAAPVAGFADKARQFFAALPEDYQMVYLGGQLTHYDHTEHPPEVINEQVIRPWSCNRTHAYGLTRAGMKIVYVHLSRHNWQTGHHVDHHIEQLSRAQELITYAPREWLIGQAPGLSDISNKEFPERSFQPKPLPIVIAVVGPYRSGASAIAGALHHLGIPMGKQFFSAREEACPKGSFEAKGLHVACRQCYPEPGFVEALAREERVAILRRWLRGRRGEEPVVGAKNPKLCLLIPEMLAAWPECKIIAVDRRMEDSIASLEKAGWFRQAWKPAELIRKLIQKRDGDLAGVPKERVLHIAFERFLAEPRTELKRVAEFAKIQPSLEKYEKALAHVDPGLKHYSN